ncbi:hypothetical protein [Paraburkholderia fungorum]|uniref:hypothetical protein n=1 Tax=Paraburkholderia fungorum TaxID=134537 RepID=UPI0009455248|nr:hypothetical protein [Paraburkholderia fungorum]
MFPRTAEVVSLASFAALRADYVAIYASASIPLQRLVCHQTRCIKDGVKMSSLRRIGHFSGGTVASTRTALMLDKSNTMALMLDLSSI